MTDEGLDRWKCNHADDGCRTLGDKPTGRCAGRYCERVRVVGEWYDRRWGVPALLGERTALVNEIDRLKGEIARLKGKVRDG